MRNYISNAELEELGEGIILGYTKGETDKLERIDIEGLITEYLHLAIEYKRFAEDDMSKIGFLANGITPLCIYSGNRKIERVFGKGTIVLDSFLLRKEESGRRRFTLSHEAAHWLLERHNPPQVAFRTEYDEEQEYSVKELRRMFSMMESQADRLAAVMLMPEYTVRNALRRYAGTSRIKVYGNSVFAQKEKIAMQRMADHMGVSWSALYYRLKELNLLEPRDIQEYLSENLKLGVIPFV
ncbi:MAG: ImmA/IrrE family metallo-endopeptidase [Lachnospiraceae bacterium]|nr:ImmA/IrrE family metallo-endopeptidase [Lachnospiraceae bacterium]